MIIYLANFLHKLLDTLSNIFRDKPNSNIFLFTFTPPILFLIVLALAFAPMSVDQNREWGFSYPWKLKLGEGNKKKLYYLWEQQQDFSLETMTHKLEKHFSSWYHKHNIHFIWSIVFGRWWIKIRMNGDVSSNKFNVNKTIV